MSDKLTPKKEKQYRIFAQEYIIKFNGTESAIKAGYSKKSARVTASRLLTQDNIQILIQKYMKERERRTEITGDMVIAELSKTAFIQESDFYHDNGDVKKLSELTNEQKAGLSSYGFKSLHIGDGEYIDVPVFKAQDKIKSLELLGKHFGIFNEKTETVHSGHITMLPPRDEDN